MCALSVTGVDISEQWLSIQAYPLHKTKIFFHAANIQIYLILTNSKQNIDKYI